MTKEFAFNHDSIVQLEVARIIDVFRIKHVIETGTCYGNSTSFFASCGCNTHTIAIDENNYNVSVQNLKEFENVHCYFGDSKNILPSILKSLPNELTLFYLDAHWEYEWPLLSEIEIISKFRHNNAIIIIDDFVVPNRNLQYDTYHGKQNDLDMSFEALRKVFDDFVYYYNDNANYKGTLFMKNCYGVGKIYVFPSRLALQNNIEFYKTIDGNNYSNL